MRAVAHLPLRLLLQPDRPGLLVCRDLLGLPHLLGTTAAEKVGVEHSAAEGAGKGEQMRVDAGRRCCLLGEELVDRGWVGARIDIAPELELYQRSNSEQQRLATSKQQHLMEEIPHVRHCTSQRGKYMAESSNFAGDKERQRGSARPVAHLPRFVRRRRTCAETEKGARAVIVLHTLAAGRAVRRKQRGLQQGERHARWPGISRRRDCHSAASPPLFSRCFNRR